MNERSLFVNMVALAAMTLLIVLLSQAQKPPRKHLKPPDAATALDSLNSKNSSAKSVFCPSIRTGILSKSTMFYEKPQKILFTTEFMGAKEAIVAQDGSNYWFWIRSFDKQSIYFCRPEKIDSAGLRAIMRPEVICSLSWIEEIRPDSIKEADGRITATCKKGETSKIIEFDSEKIIKQTILFKGSPVATLAGSSFKDFSGFTFPTRIVATWHEEGMSGNFSVDEWIVNEKCPEISEPQGLKRKELIR